MVLANCLASTIVVGSPLQAALGVLGVLAAGAACGAINGTDRHLRPAAADRHDDRHRRDLLRRGARAAPRAGRRHRRHARRCADRPAARRHPGQPGAAARAGAVHLGAVPALGRSGRAAYAVGSSEVAAYMSGVPIRRAKFVAYTLSGLLASIAGLFVTCITYVGRGVGGQRQHLHAVFDRRGRTGRRVAVRRFGQRGRCDLRRADVPHDRRPAVRVRPRAAVAAAVPGRRARSPRCASARCGCCACATGSTSMAETATPRAALGLGLAVAAAPARPGDRRWAFGCIVVLLLRRQPVLEQLPVARVPAAAAEGRRRSSASSPPAR